jgi:hypothetical protein
VDNNSLDSSYTSPLINGLSDHDGQFSIIHNICASKNKIQKKKKREQDQKTNKERYTHNFSDTTRTRKLENCLSKTRF